MGGDSADSDVMLALEDGQIDNVADDGYSGAVDCEHPADGESLGDNESGSLEGDDLDDDTFQHQLMGALADSNTKGAPDSPLKPAAVEHTDLNQEPGPMDSASEANRREELLARMALVRRGLPLSKIWAIASNNV